MSEAAGLAGDFRLVCAAREDGSTFVAKQSFAAPFHLSKTYWSGGILLVHIVNQTAGFFGGDHLDTSVTVEPGASVLLSSPSAARFHPSGGREMRLEQRFQVRAGGFLDVFPEISIPQRNCRVGQRTQIDIERGGEMIYLETLAPGRVASGESFAFDRFAWRTDVRFDGRLIHRERTNLSPEGASLAPLRAFYAASYYAGLLLVSPRAESWDTDFAREVGALGEGTVLKIGASRLVAGGWSVRLLAPDALVLRSALNTLRELTYKRFGRPLPNARRY